MTPQECARAEALLAAYAGIPDGTTVPRALADHLEACADCMRLARELENPIVADAIGEAAEGAAELLELAVVPSENYVRGREIGRGGMGRIVRARDRRLGRSVAIKELLDERMRARFEREARLTARLQHPAIVSVHEAGRWPGGEPFYAMKLVAGRPLDQLIGEATTLASRLALLPHYITVVDAIAYAHSEGVIHRDLKPGNVLVGAFGETVVIDWGLAKDLLSSDPDPGGPYRDAPEAATRNGFGTPAYMPPEQEHGAALVDERADVYALGATLYHIVTGAPPSRERRPLAEVAPEAPAELGTVAAKAMAPDPADRYPSARELAEELRRFQSGQLVGAHRYTMRDLAGRWLRRHRLALGFAAAFVLALAGVGGVSVARIVAARHEAVAERDRARRAYAEILAERGRQELLSGAPARALAYLHGALAAGVDTPALRFLLAEARRSTAPLLLSVPAGAVAALDGAGTLLAAGDPVRLWDVASGAELGTLPTSAARIAFAPGGDRLLVVGRGRPVVEIWEARARRLVAALPHAGPVEGATWSDDGSKLLSWSGTTARVWSAAGAPLVDLRGHEDEVRGGAFDAAGARVITGGRDGTARVWDATTGKLLLTLRGHRNGVAAGAFDPTGAGFATAGWEGKVMVWDAAGKPVRTLDLGESVRAVSYTPDGEMLLAHGASTARLWRVSGETVATLGQSGWGVAAARLIGDGTRVFVAGVDGVARLYDTTGVPGPIFEGHTGSLLDAGASGDGERLLTRSADGTVKVWQRGGRGEPREILPGGGAVFDARGRLLTLSWKKVALWDAASGRLLSARELDQTPWKVTPPRFAGLVGGRVRLMTEWGERMEWDPDTGDLSVPVPGPTVAAITDAGDRMIAASLWPPYRARPDENEVVLDSATGAPVAILEDSGGTVWEVFSPDGRRIAGEAKGSLRVWDVVTGRALARLPLRRGTRSAAFSPDGGSVFVYGDDLDGQLWDVGTGRLVQVFRGHSDRLWTATFSPDGALILTGSQDGTARMWDARTGQPLVSWSLPGGPVNKAVISPDGRYALLGTASSSRIFEVGRDGRDAGAVAAEIAARVPFRLDEGRLLPATPPATARGEASPASGAPAFACPPGMRRHGAPPPADLITWCAGADGLQAGPLTIYWPNGQRMTESTLDGGKRRERTTLRDPSGRVTSAVDSEGRMTTVTRFHPDGSRMSVQRFWGHLPVGPYTAWYPSGVVRETGSYEDCPAESASCVARTTNGVWTTYYEDGRKQSEGRYIVRNGFPFIGNERDIRGGDWTFWTREGVARVEHFTCAPELAPYALDICGKR